MVEAQQLVGNREMREIPEIKRSAEVTIQRMLVRGAVASVTSLFLGVLPNGISRSVRKKIMPFILGKNPADVFGDSTGEEPAVHRPGEIIVTDPELIDAIAEAEKKGDVTRLEPEEGGKLARILSRSSLTTPTGSDPKHKMEWRYLSSQIADPLKPNSVAAMTSQIDDLAAASVEKLSKQKDTVDILHYSTEFALQVLLKITFGDDISDEYINKIRPVWNDINRLTSVFMIQPATAQPSKKLQERQAQLEAIVTELIEKEKKREGTHHHLAFQFTHPAEGERKPTDEQIMGQVKTLFLAGHETTSLALGWTLHFISTHPEVREKVYDEIRTMLATCEAEPGTAKNYRALTYTTQVIKEAMRLLPPIWSLVPRSVNRDHDVDVGGFRFPAGERILVQLGRAHKDPKIWGPDAAEFKPERFDNIDDKQKKAYNPFYRGAHVCPGRHLSMLEMQVWLVTMVEKGIELEEVEEPIPFAFLTQGSLNKIKMRVKQGES